MDTPQYEQQQLFFTQAEVDAKLSEAFTEQAQAVHRAYINTSDDLRDRAIAWFKAEANNTMTKEDALSIFNGLAEALNWDTVTSIGSTYTVTVSINDLEVGTFDNVEADDEDDAVAQVLENLDAELSMEVSYGNQTITETYSGWNLEVTATAVEED